MIVFCLDWIVKKSDLPLANYSYLSGVKDGMIWIRESVSIGYVHASFLSETLD